MFKEQRNETHKNFFRSPGTSLSHDQKASCVWKQDIQAYAKSTPGDLLSERTKKCHFFVWERHVLILALAQRAYLFPRKVRYWAYLLSYLRPNPSAAYREKERGRRGLSRQTNGSGHIETLPEIASAKKETWIVRRWSGRQSKQTKQCLGAVVMVNVCPQSSKQRFYAW